MNTTWEEKVTLIIAVQCPSGSDLRWNHDFLKRKPKRVTQKVHEPLISQYNQGLIKVFLFCFFFNLPIDYTYSAVLAQHELPGRCRAEPVSVPSKHLGVPAPGHLVVVAHGDCWEGGGACVLLVAVCAHWVGHVLLYHVVHVVG